MGRIGVFLLICLLLSLNLKATLPDLDQDYIQMDAAAALPYIDGVQEYSWVEIQAIFKPLFLTPQVTDLFNAGFSLLMDPQNGRPSHRGTKLIDMWRCLYGDLWAIKNLISSDSLKGKARDQKNIITARLQGAAHMAIFKLKDPALHKFLEDHH